MASMNYVSASDVGGKMKTAGAVKASIRHDDKDERIKMQTHKNEFIDKTLTPYNVDFLGLSYEEKCARFDDRIRELDETTNTNKRKDRVLAFGLHTVIPDTLSIKDQISFARDIVGLYADKYGRENIVSADFHQDEGHNYVDSRTHKVVHSLNGLHMTVIPEVDGKLNGKAFSSRAAIKEMTREIDALAREKYHVPYLKFEEHEKGGFKSVEDLQRMSDAFCQERETQLEDIERDVRMAKRELKELDAEIDETSARLGQAQKTIDEAQNIEDVSQNLSEGRIGLNLGLVAVIPRKEMQGVKKALSVSERLIDMADALKSENAALAQEKNTLEQREASQKAREAALNERERDIGEEVRQGVEKGLKMAQSRLEGLVRDMCDIFKGVPFFRSTRSKQNEYLFGAERLDYIKDEYGEDFPELSEACLEAAETVDEARDVRKYADIGRAVVELPENARNAVRDVLCLSDKRAARELDDFTKEKTRGRDVGFTR